MNNVSIFNIYRNYNINCKLYLPEDDVVRKVILGVHGFAGDKESSVLSALAQSTSKENTALICFDFPAHGASPQNEDYLTVENCMNDLLAVSDWVRNSYPDSERSIFATSFGGYISLLCASKLEDFTFVLRAPAVTMPNILLNSVLKISREDFRERCKIECGFERKIQLPYIFYEELLRFSPMDICCKQPILIIHGDKDDVVPYEDVKAFCKTHPGTELVTIEGADHRFKNSGDICKIVNETKKFLLKYAR